MNLMTISIDREHRRPSQTRDVKVGQDHLSKPVGIVLNPEIGSNDWLPVPPTSGLVEGKPEATHSIPVHVLWRGESQAIEVPANETIEYLFFKPVDNHGMRDWLDVVDPTKAVLIVIPAVGGVKTAAQGTNLIE